MTDIFANKTLLNAQSITRRGIKILDHLVAFQTTNDRSNLDLISFVETLFAPLGARMERAGGTESKTNLIVSVGPNRPGGIVLSGHTDVVPTTGQDWSRDPFKMWQDGGRLYGRGTTDMKGFVAMAIATAEAAAHENLTLPLHLALSYDEEIGCIGVPPMAARLGEPDFAPSLVVVGEPSLMQVIDGHKGGAIGIFQVRGLAGHSSLSDRLVNAVSAGAEITCYLNGLAKALRNREQNNRFDPPFSTISVNRLHGGTHGNIVPESCELLWEMRLLPGQSTEEQLASILAHVAAEIEPWMKAVEATTGIRHQLVNFIPALNVNSDKAATALALLLSQTTVPKAVSYGSEAGFFQRHKIPAVICGPGDIAQAHKPDEFVEIMQLESCGLFMQRLIQHLTKGSK